MTSVFKGEKYETASLKAIEFIKRQLNVNNYTLFPKFSENYNSEHTGRIIAKVEMPADAKVNFPNYIYCDQFYDEEYQGVVSGKHQNIGNARRNLAVEITIHTDQQYCSAVCFLHSDGTWRSETYYRETDFYGVGDVITRSETYWYRKDKIINENGSNGIKGFTLKYYNWVDENGVEVDLDNLPEIVKETINPVPVDPDTGEPMSESFLYAETYTLNPILVDDTIIDDALPRYADYDATLYVFADVEYLTESTNIIYDETVTAEDLPSSPAILPSEPEPFIRDAIVQPGIEKGKLILTWITNFPDDCTLILDGVSQKVSGEVVVSGYYTYHAVVEASLNIAHTYSISGNGVSIIKSFQYNDSSRYLICGDPQIIDQSSAEVWYKVQKILNPLPAMIISMGDQVDAITDALIRTEQFHLFTAEHSVPIATVRGNHDKNENYFGHFGLPDNANGANFYFKNNDVLFISIDTNSDDVEEHKSFIRSALDNNSYRWSILLMHHSLYSTSQRALTTHIKTLREGLTSFIVEETDICMVLAGHEHFLCRTCYPGKLFFTTATSTGSKYEVDDYTEAPWNELTINTSIPKYTVMDVYEDVIMLNTYDINGKLVDSCCVN